MSSRHQRIKWHRNVAENFNRLSRVQTDDRQTTDGRTTTYEHEFTFAKNEVYKKTIIGDILVTHLKRHILPFRQTCNVLFRHYVLGRMLLAL